MVNQNGISSYFFFHYKYICKNYNIVNTSHAISTRLRTKKMTLITFKPFSFRALENKTEATIRNTISKKAIRPALCIGFGKAPKNCAVARSKEDALCKITIHLKISTATRIKSISATIKKILFFFILHI